MPPEIGDGRERSNTGKLNKARERLRRQRVNSVGHFPVESFTPRNQIILLPGRHGLFPGSGGLDLSALHDVHEPDSVLVNVERKRAEGAQLGVRSEIQFVIERVLDDRQRGSVLGGWLAKAS